ncbi:MAG: hypothetical protein MUP16_12290 [Sedimentisphaerales bacterium]|nr:hypothetical protein [Sedimentisphaerales bacterium]
MSEYKAGLHKKVSAIFNGVSLPKGNDAQQPSAAPAPGHQDYIAPKSPAPEPPATKSPAPSHMTPTKPKPQQPPPKAAPAKQPKAAIKTARQTPWQRTLEQIKNKLFAPKPGVNTTRQKVTVIAVPVLFIVLIFVFVRVFSTPSRKITGPGTSGPVKAAAAVSDSKVDWQAPELYPTALRDPMQFSSVSAEGGPGGLIVKGIVYSEDNPATVIGSQIVHQGDKVLDITIVKINENSVEFEANGKKWTQQVQR